MPELVPLPPSPPLPAVMEATGDRARLRFLEFFASAIRNPHTRRAYVRAAVAFLDWCAAAGVPSLIAVQPLHVATWIEGQTRTHAAPTVKQRLAAIRHLFDWLVTGQIVATNPAGSVRGPAYRVKTGKTPVLEAEEARRLLDSIDTRTPAGLRDRALMALMVYSFARIGAALGMKVEDAYTPASFGLPEPPDLFEYLPMTAPRDALGLDPVQHLRQCRPLRRRKLVLGLDMHRKPLMCWSQSPRAAQAAVSMRPDGVRRFLPINIPSDIRRMVRW